MRKTFLLLAVVLLPTFVLAQDNLLRGEITHLKEGPPPAEWFFVNDTTSFVILDGIFLCYNYRSIYLDLIGEKYFCNDKTGPVVRTSYYYALNGYLYGNTAKERRRLKADHRKFMEAHCKGLLDNQSKDNPLIRVIPRKELLLKYSNSINPKAPGVIVVTYNFPAADSLSD